MFVLPFPKGKPQTHPDLRSIQTFPKGQPIQTFTKGQPIQTFTKGRDRLLCF